MGPSSELEEARGFIGYSLGYSGILKKKKETDENKLYFLFTFLVDLLTEIWEPAYTITGGQMQNFISVFSVYFPASIGILAGANVSGDLKVKYSSILSIILKSY
jgi:solute carrier family 12 sodium/potassium/chloride transporter 2